MKKRETVEWDGNNIQSLKKAERKKRRLENAGYTFVKSVRLGLDGWLYLYEMR